ncbi:hypothetical protein [Candidatus Poriferisodalis sp.]|uniref:hypothetical protein n=1 Tax=Candidatus Poriferisodalis sp. TaxID=3101277 RepID=UPI003B02319F
MKGIGVCGIGERVGLRAQRDVRDGSVSPAGCSGLHTARLAAVPLAVRLQPVALAGAGGS